MNAGHWLIVASVAVCSPILILAALAWWTNTSDRIDDIIADAQAIQDAPSWGEHADTACALTVGPQLPADQWTAIEGQMHDAYDTYRTKGLLPGETRTTWTREDYTS